MMMNRNYLLQSVRSGGKTEKRKAQSVGKTEKRMGKKMKMTEMRASEGRERKKMT
jgi:hypothetical protein